ncbi:hypothetical protein RF55_18151 [Lasius niger]|uniref:Uncharacterized protein n=1 Tax=Lasius niger TaxID=67767 RepID=A0A0J7K1Q3_LASNI|nr:hypothetical protein RF55_18151 [Lasius niger]
MSEQYTDKNVTPQKSSDPPVAGVEGVSPAPSPSSSYEGLAGAFPACVPSFLASADIKEDTQELERDVSPAPSAVPSVPSSSVDTTACLTASEKEEHMYISDAESGHRTVFEGSPSETQEDTENKISNKRITLSQKGRGRENLHH